MVRKFNLQVAFHHLVIFIRIDVRPHWTVLGSNFCSDVQYAKIYIGNISVKRIIEIKFVNTCKGLWTYVVVLIYRICFVCSSLLLLCGDIERKQLMSQADLLAYRANPTCGNNYMILPSCDDYV